MAAVLGYQIVMMALLMAVGVWLVKVGLLSERGCGDLGAILLKVVIPCVIVRSYMIEFSPEKLADLGQAAGLSCLALVLAMVVSSLVFGRQRSVENFAASFSNAGFIGIPLTQAVFGKEAVFYVAAYVALLNLFQWTWGLYVMTGNRIQIRVILKNPVFLGICVGLTAFFLPLPIPDVLGKAVGYIADLNTPLAMIILGSYLVKTGIRELLLTKKIYLCVLLRMAVIPLATLAFFRILPVSASDPVIVLTILIAASTPVGSNIAIFAQQNGKDPGLAVQTVCLSTLLSVVTVPALFGLAEYLGIRAGM